MSAITVDSNPHFSFFFLKHQLELLNTPFALFESASLIVGIIAVLVVVALIIATVFVVKAVIEAIGKVRAFHFYHARAIECCFVCHVYIPSYHKTYLVTRRLRN